MPKRVELTLDFMTANEAVQERPQAAAASMLRAAADRIEDADDEGLDSPIWDINGNRIGQFFFSIEEDGE